MALALPSIIVCGSQTPPPSRECLQRIRSNLKNPKLKELAKAVDDLPQFWSRLVEIKPVLSQVNDEPLQKLKDWVGDECFLEIPKDLPNILLAPLTVITHLVQYLRFVHSLDADDSQEDRHRRILQSTCKGGFQGLCTGFLSAAALACSRTDRDIWCNATVALRLATCVGGYVDLDRLTFDSTDVYVCMIIHWEDNCGKDRVTEVLKGYPGVYTSVELDDRNITVTAKQSQVSSLRADLAARNAKVTNIPIHGRYHSITHAEILQDLLEICNNDESLRFPVINPPLVPLRNNTTGDPITSAEKLHELALQSVLTKPANWYSTMTETISSLKLQPEKNHRPLILELGLVSCLPRSLTASANLQVFSPPLTSTVSPKEQKPSTNDEYCYDYPEHSIAVIGAACKFTGADSMQQFWELIRTGGTMVDDLPEGRIAVDKSLRKAPRGKPLSGNFLSDAGHFDHGLFGVSPREATYMDPQQRIALRVAYQAVESSEYFGSDIKDKNIGCYVGVGGSDYDHNVCSHAPTAFSFTGTARAFVSGRISHYFGWTGPSMTIDTACSSSAVAIHQACKDIRMGECRMALAGGVNIISCPNMQENLAAARFLSPTGPCRPFDASADGYCRGEGCGFVMLKKLSCAVADNDDILGVIVGSAANHCDGNDAITVPTSHSQVNLYRKALSLAAMQPKDITYVEAHGTGTPRGDPVECRSIRQVFGGSRPTLHFGSVKANIGHTEAASGIAGLLKVLLMIRNQRIPPQANFTALNASIPPLEPDNLSVPINELEWKATFRAACINNYGAAGNNAAVIVCEPPRPDSSAGNNDRLSGYPFLITGQSERSLKMYCTALSHWLDNAHAPLSDIAFNVARRQNRTLRHRIAFAASSLSDLRSILGQKARPHEQLSSPSSKPKPVVLVFAGQTRNIVYLHKAAYEGSRLLRSHIDECDGILRRMGHRGLIPFLFDQQPIEDVVLLHCLFFSLQYACAAAWLGAGLPVRRVIGHSIGQFTAMCISGVTTLADTLKLVAGRARLIQQKWGKERGCMLAVEVDRQGALEVARSVPDHKIEIACFNGARNHVLVGTEVAINTLEGKTSCKTRRLKTTHGFHSAMVDCLLDDYMALARNISYATPNIPIETCSMGGSWKEFTPELVVRHSREAVYFFDAISRVNGELGPCTWVEGGAGSRGIALVKCALGIESSSGHSFHRLQLDSSEPLASLTETTMQMWNEGLDVQFWLYHNTEKTTFASCDVPGYQFDETAFWLVYSDKAGQSDSEQERIFSDEHKPLVYLLKDEGFRGEARKLHFGVNHVHPDFSRYLNGREVLGEVLCPVSVFVELAAKAAAISSGCECSMAFAHVQVLDLEIHNPLGHARGVRVGLRLKHVGPCKWGFSIISEKDAQSICHATGTISLKQERHGKSEMGSQWSVIQRVIGYSHIQDIIDDRSAISMKGSLIYKVLEKVAEYKPCYMGIKAMTIKDTAAVAQLEMPTIGRNSSEIAVCDPLVMDQVTLIAEVLALCRDDCKRDDVFICSGLNELITFTSLKSEMGPWTVYTRQTLRGPRELLSDTFVFDSTSKQLIVAILGARFVRITTSSLDGIVKKASLNGQTSELSVEREAVYEPATEACRPSDDSEVSDIDPILSRLLHEITGISPSQISASTLLVEAGVDSLAATELENRIQEVFNLHRPISLYERQFDVGTLCREIQTQRDDRLARASRTTTATRNTSSSLGRRTSSTGSLSVNAEARPISNSDAVLAQLSRMLSESFNVRENILPGTELRSLGLDSLVAVELESDLQQAFGLKVDLMQLSSELTMGGLARLILASKSQASRHMAPPMVDSGQMTEPESQTYLG
ncbi:type I iterative polyketide synthase [Aspergillus pseudoviridinutans]|uniref:Type I iterative polyketide synthase n=1 Tax=Aspergillus pseudoviridinutans TaxID=1517512 RepID=A0A9P3BK93_9EURO|nr:type I iterative polyketide synthase [Aspergillus pseudoviridinutans]GIJ90855.1 type I iterative polyketide synthase [Aspergillus pseudoviridinutans]